MSGSLSAVLVGGGTGGHIYALLAIAEELQRRVPTASLTFIGQAGRMEAELVPRAGYQPLLLDLPLPSEGRAGRWSAVARQVRAYQQSCRVLAECGAQVVVGTGGQVCGPVLLAARRRGVPAVLLEPNAIPGRANRLVARLARPRLIGITMPEARKHFPAGARIEETGYPLRPAILTAERTPSAHALGLDPARRTVLFTGGSLGSEHLNEALIDLLPRLRAPWADGLQILHLGGWVNAKTLAAERVSELAVRYVYRPYLHEMELALAAADLVVGRAGATALAELTARGLPAILVPLPNAADDHQSHNAQWMAAAGAAVVVPDAELTADRLEAELSALVRDSDRLAAMAAASRRLGRPEAGATVVSAMLDLVRNP